MELIRLSLCLVSPGLFLTLAMTLFLAMLLVALGTAE